MSNANRRRSSALLFLGYAIWSGVLTFFGQPVLGPLCALVWLELGITHLRLAALTGSAIDDSAVSARVEPMMQELCFRSRTPVPSVVIRDDALRAAAVTRSRGGGVTLTLSRPFTIRVSDMELRAILAHEIVHIVHGDLSAARARGLLACAIGAAGMLLTMLVAHGGGDLPIWLAGLVVCQVAATVGLSVLNRPRESRADCEGAALSGDPAALARALMAGHAVAEEVRAQLFGRPPMNWLLAPMSWRLPSHPSTSSRIARLQAIGGRVAGGGSDVTNGLALARDAIAPSRSHERLRREAAVPE